MNVLMDLALFPLRCLRAYLLPLPFIFVAERGRARWDVVWSYVVGLPLIASGLAYLCSVSPLARSWGIHPFSPEVLGSYIGYGFIGTLALFFFYQGLLNVSARKFQGKASFVAQCYTTLLSLTVTVTIASVIGLLLFTNSGLYTDARHWLMIAGAGVLLYGMLQLIVIISAVHELPLYKSVLSVFAPLWIIFMFLLLLLTEVEYRNWLRTPEGRLLGRRQRVGLGAGWQQSEYEQEGAAQQKLYEVMCPLCRSNAWTYTPYGVNPCPRCGISMNSTGNSH